MNVITLNLDSREARASLTRVAYSVKTTEERATYTMDTELEHEEKSYGNLAELVNDGSIPSVVSYLAKGLMGIQIEGTK